jgi:RNA polymerase sigma factor (sigma-70 family)
MISSNGEKRANGNGAAPEGAGRFMAELFDAHARMVLGLCRLILRDPVEAEDAAQQTFLSAYRSLLRGTDPRDPAAWLAEIARNECRARLRRRELAAVPSDDVEARAADLRDASDLADDRERMQVVTAAVADLPDRQREAVVLRDFRGLSYGELAQALAIPRGAVEGLVYRGRQHVRAALRRSWPATIVVPPSLRDALARLIPDFGGQAGAGAAGITAALGAKALAAPAAKVAAGVALALATVGATTVEIEHALVRPKAPPAQRAHPARPKPANLVVRADVSSGPVRERPHLSGPRGGANRSGSNEHQRDSGRRRVEDGENTSSGPGPAPAESSSGPGSGSDSESGSVAVTSSGSNGSGSESSGSTTSSASSGPGSGSSDDSVSVNSGPGSVESGGSSVSGSSGPSIDSGSSDSSGSSSESGSSNSGEPTTDSDSSSNSGPG